MQVQNFRDLARIKAEFSQIRHTSAVFHAEQEYNHTNRKSLHLASKKTQNIVHPDRKTGRRRRTAASFHLEK